MVAKKWNEVFSDIDEMILVVRYSSGAAFTFKRVAYSVNVVF